MSFMVSVASSSLSKLINPYQGLKLTKSMAGEGFDTLSKLINPYQGLKLFKRLGEKAATSFKAH